MWTLKVHVALQYMWFYIKTNAFGNLMLKDRIIGAISYQYAASYLYSSFLFSFLSARKSGYKVQPSQELVALGMTALHVVRSICINAIIVQSIGIDGCLDK